MLPLQRSQRGGQEGRPTQNLAREVQIRQENVRGTNMVILFVLIVIRIERFV